MRVSCFKLEVLDLCNFLLCLQRRREAHEILLFKSVLGRSPRQIRMVPDTTNDYVCTANVVVLAAVIDSHLKSLPMIIKRNSLEFATNIVVTFPLKYVSWLIPVSINIICGYPFSLKNVNHRYVSYKLQTLLISTNVCLLLSICKVIYLKK